MSKTITIALIASALTLTSIFGSVTLNLGFGTMYSTTNEMTTVPLGARINFLAVEGNGSGTWSSLGDLNTLFSNLTNSWSPSGTRLIGSIFNNDAGGPGFTTGSIIYSYSGAFQPGDQLLMVVYPTLDNSDTSPSTNTIGNFFRTDAVIDGSDIAWVAPADGGTFILSAATLGSGGSVPNNTFTSGAGASGGNGFTTVPEPATYALLAMSALGMGGYMIRRRRR